MEFNSGFKGLSRPTKEGGWGRQADKSSSLTCQAYPCPIPGYDTIGEQLIFSTDSVPISGHICSCPILLRPCVIPLWGEWIKGQRISWLSHLERMEENRMPKKIFTQELEGMRRRGRPRKGWREEVEGDLQVLGVRRWRELVMDREKWRCIVRQPKAHSGL